MEKKRELEFPITTVRELEFPITKELEKEKITTTIKLELPIITIIRELRVLLERRELFLIIAPVQELIITVYNFILRRPYSTKNQL